MPAVYSRRKGSPPIPTGAVYVGRPTRWGNPFPVGAYTQEAAVEAYREWLKYQPDLQRDIRRELRGKDLVCWCAPKPCHADVLLEVANGD